MLFSKKIFGWGPWGPGEEPEELRLDMDVLGVVRGIKKNSGRLLTCLYCRYSIID